MEGKTTHKRKDNKKTKLFIIILICVLLLIFIYSFAFFRANNFLLNISSKNILQSTNNTASSISNSLKNDSVLLEAFSNDIKKYEQVKDDSFYSYLKSNYKNYTFSYNYITYINKDGVIWTSNGESSIFKEYNNVDSLFKANEITISNNKLWGTYKGSIYTFIPVETDNEIDGFLIGAYDSSYFNNSYLSSTYKNESITYIIDSSGKKIVSCSDKVPYNIEFNSLFDIASASSSNKDATEELIKDLENGKDGYKNLYLNDVPFILSFSKIDDINNWYSVSLVPKNVALVNINYLVFTSTLIGALLIVIIAIIAYGYLKASAEHSEKIKDLAYNDTLTGYPNFSKFKIDYEDIISKSKGIPYCLCYADMVGFKFINETFGYDAGDNILKSISKVLDSMLDDDERFARVSGDRFIILKKYDFAKNQANELLFSVVDKISKIPPLSSSRMRLEVHVGVYIIEPKNELKINAMFDRAIIALESITRSDSCYAVYDEALRTVELEKKFIEQKMEPALKNGEFQVYIQPKYKTSDRTLAAGEALIRWHDPQKGVIPPIQFIPLFEKNRFIFNLDRYVLEVVCRFLRKRINENKEIVPISLNVSPVEISMPNFTQSYISIKQKYSIPDGIIELEFTEGVFFENQELFKKVIIELKDAGFCCSLDDFGSGYSSLNVLKEMPVDVLKLDRLFFRESDDIVKDRSLIRSVVAMARSLKIKTVAEGVETLDTVEFLKLIGCNMIQGYIYARPMPISEFETLMNNERISNYTDFSEDYDKFSEVIPVDKPYDIPLRDTYEAIFELNVNAGTYHIYKQENCSLDFDDVDEIGEYLYEKDTSILSKVHEEDVSTVLSVFNSSNLHSYFKTKRELKIDIRVLNKNGNYIWIRCRLLKAKNIDDNLVIFVYLKNIEDQKSKDDLLQTAETRLYSAFMGVAGLVYELDLKNGHASLLKSYSQHMKSTLSGNEYEPTYNFIATYLMDPDYTDNFIKECSLVTLREQFSQSPNKTLYYEYRAKPDRTSEKYRWYSVRFTYTPELSDKVMIFIQDISKQKYNEHNIAIRSELMSLALKHAYDELIEINLTQNMFHYTKIIDRDNNKEEVKKGEYSEFYSQHLKNQFLYDDRDFINQIISPKGLATCFNDPNVSDFTINIKKKVDKDTYQWHSLYLIPNHLSIPFPDDVVFILIKNIQFDKDIQDRLSTVDRRLTYTTGMFNLAYELNIKEKMACVFGGINIPSEIITDQSIEYEKLINNIRTNFIHPDDYIYFNENMNFDSLLKQLKTASEPISFFIRCNIPGIKWILIKHIFDSRNNVATVFIQNMDNNNMQN